MKKIIKIDGMMCIHCAARVKKALEKIAGVESAEINLESGLAVVMCDDSVMDAAFISAVSEAGYTVLHVE